MKQKVDASSSSRWWEFYFVRYSTGTVIGGVIVFFLCSTNPILQKMLLLNMQEINGPLLALYAAYGLTFCYIASAPILVMHTVRFLFDIHSNEIKLKRFAWMLVPPIPFTIIYFYLCGQKTLAPNIYTAAFLLGIAILWPQFYAIIMTVKKRDEFFNFYQILANKRQADKGNFVESYKHLREHGNSFLIIVFEFFFGAILYIFGNYHITDINSCNIPPISTVIPYIIVILLWALPASFVWFIGMLLERSFCDDSKNIS